MGNQTCCASQRTGVETVCPEVQFKIPMDGAVGANDHHRELEVDPGVKCQVCLSDQLLASNVLSWIKSLPPRESPCLKTLQRCFPSAVPGMVVVNRLGSVLGDRGFTPENTIYGQSLCPDEINCLKGGMAYTLADYWGECFPMGGIGGAPFVGKTGFMAFSHHVPKDGNVLVVFGPHIAISESGELGKHLREGQKCESTACGAVLAAYGALMDGETKWERQTSKESASSLLALDSDDMQQEWLKRKLGEKIDSIKSADEPLRALAYAAYECCETKMKKIVNNNFGTGKLVLVGGIQINMPDSCDEHFQPLMFQVISKDGHVEDLLSEFRFKANPTLQSVVPRSFDFFAWNNMSPNPTSQCFGTMHRCFPGALPGEIIVRKTCDLLIPFGLTPENTIYGQSLCPDEINCVKGGMASSLIEYWGECFPMGGIGGAPFVGKTGFKAFSHHVPDDGNVLICFGPHIAISSSGELGKVLREGQECESAACGAVLAAYAAVSKEPFFDCDDDDMQQDWLKSQIAPRVDEIKQQQDPLSALAYVAYDCVQRTIQNIINNDFGKGKLVLLGGIQINMPLPYKDHFLPLMFKVLSHDGSEVNLLPELSLVNCEKLPTLLK